VTCHCDLHPDNVLVDGTGELVLLDWDDAGPACPDRELAGVLVFWHVDEAGSADDAAVRALPPIRPRAARPPSRRAVVRHVHRAG
jgi:thiamine kinase-like enzyme